MPETFTSQGSTQAGWNLWLQGKTRTSSPFVKSSVHIEQPGFSPSGLGSFFGLSGVVLVAAGVLSGSFCEVALLAAPEDDSGAASLFDVLSVTPCEASCGCD